MEKSNKKRTRFLVLLFVLSLIASFLLDIIENSIDSSFMIHILGINLGRGFGGTIVRTLITSSALLGLFLFKYRNEDIRPRLSFAKKFDIPNYLISLAAGFGFVRLNWSMSGRDSLFVVAFIFFAILDGVFSYIVHLYNYRIYTAKYIILSIWIFLLSSFLACIYSVGIIAIAIIVGALLLFGNVSLDGFGSGKKETFSRYGAWEDGAADARNGIAPRSKDKKYLDGYYTQDVWGDK